ncbi:MAG: hypothetical protein LBT68_05705 [Spirochaetales bacterium]|jgi:hypothetical protein|nr:hypothetical protein [Spirochaetales bacterium]
MTFPELAAALEERFYFYKTVLDKMAEAVKAGEANAIEAYSKLETRTAAEIVVFQRCFIARMAEAPRASEFLHKVETARTAARAASLHGRDILVKEKEATAAQLKEVRKRNQRTGFQRGSPPPSVIDIEA